MYVYARVCSTITLFIIDTWFYENGVMTSYLEQFLIQIFYMTGHEYHHE